MCFLPCPSNIVTALAKGPVQGVSQAGSLSVFSLAHLTLSLPWLMELWGARQLVSGGLQQKPGLPARSHLWWLLAGRPGSRQVAEAVSGVRPACKTSNVDISAPRCARAILTADLDTWQGRLQNFKKYMSCHYAKSYTVHNYMILLLYMILHYGNWYSSKICMFVGVFQYTNLYTVYDSPLIQFSAPPLITT